MNKKYLFIALSTCLNFSTMFSMNDKNEEGWPKETIENVREWYQSFTKKQEEEFLRKVSEDRQSFFENEKKEAQQLENYKNFVNELTLYLEAKLYPVEDKDPNHRNWKHLCAINDLLKKHNLNK